MEIREIDGGMSHTKANVKIIVRIQDKELEAFIERIEALRGKYYYIQFDVEIAKGC